MAPVKLLRDQESSSLLIFSCTNSVACQEGHRKEQKSGDFAFQVLTVNFFFLFSSASSPNSLRLKRPKVKFVLILNLPLWLPCNFHSAA